MSKNNFLKDCINTVAGLEVKNESQAIAKEVVLSTLEELQQRIDNALKIAFEYSQIDGSHHKAWVIDQMIRNLLGDDYKKWVEKYMFDGQDPIEAVINENYFNWDVGVAP